MVLFNNITYQNVKYFHHQSLLKKNEIYNYNTVTNDTNNNIKINNVTNINSSTKTTIGDKSEVSDIQGNFNKTYTEYKKDNER